MAAGPLLNKCAYALGNLSANCLPNRDAALRGGGAHLVSFALQKHRSYLELVVNCARALSPLCAESERAREEVAQDGGSLVVIRSILHNPRNQGLLQNGLSCLHKIVKTPQTLAALIHQVRPRPLAPPARARRLSACVGAGSGASGGGRDARVPRQRRAADVCAGDPHAARPAPLARNSGAPHAWRHTGAGAMRGTCVRTGVRAATHARRHRAGDSGRGGAQRQPAPRRCGLRGDALAAGSAPRGDARSDAVGLRHNGPRSGLAVLGGARTLAVWLSVPGLPLCDRSWPRSPRPRPRPR